MSWLPYALLDTPLSAIAKCSIAFLGTLVFNWRAAAAIRKIPAVARVISPRLLEVM
jgi:hypothetical protein